MCCETTVEPWCDLGDPVFDGCFTEKGFVASEKETEKMVELDLKHFGCNSCERKDLIQLIESGKFPIIQSIKYPQHCYISIYGPISKCSYIIIIPNGKKEDSSIYSVYNSEGDPCNTEEMCRKAEILCGGHKPGVKIIKTVTEKTFVGNEEAYSPYYGTININKYEERQKIISLY